MEDYKEVFDRHVARDAHVGADTERVCQAGKNKNLVITVQSQYKTRRHCHVQCMHIITFLQHISVELNLTL